MYASCFRHLHLADNILPPWRSSSTVTKKLMSTPFQGASGPSGHAGLGTAPGQPTVSGNHAAPKPVLISLQQIPPKEQPISLQLRKLTVRFFADVFNLGLTNYSVVQAIRRNIAGTARGTIPSLRRSIHLTGQKESSVTKGHIDALLKLLDKLDGGTNDGDAIHCPQSTQSDALFTSVTSDPSCLIRH